MAGLSWITVLLSLFLLGCFPSKKAIFLQEENLPNKEMIISAPTKVFLNDNSVVLFPNGFEVKNHMVLGQGTRHQINESTESIKSQNFPLDNVIAMTYYELESSPASDLGSFILGLHGSVLTPLSLYCLACPKCCFGSCPTVYVNQGNKQVLKAELFSYSISKYQQEADLDLLFQKIDIAGKYSIRITNEALETHYIDLINIQKVEHPPGTNVYPTSEGNFVVTRNLLSPVQVLNSKNSDVLPLVFKRDNQCYRTDSLLFATNSELKWRDHLDLKIPSVHVGQLKLVLKLRNTLLSTVLFYDVVLGSQGLTALEWTKKINTDPNYALLFHAVYKFYSGITVKVNQQGKYQKRKFISDVGPIAWKELAVSIPVNEEDINDSSELDIRLEFFPDHFMVDYIGYEMKSDGDIPYQVNNLSPNTIEAYDGKLRPEVIQKIRRDDRDFLITNPGESYNLYFYVTTPSENEVSIFIRSKGYYIEWLRGNWLTENPGDYRFQLFDYKETIHQLKKSWLENRQLLEQEFFHSRFPLQEDI
jgi:hypothetical protein